MSFIYNAEYYHAIKSVHFRSDPRFTFRDLVSSSRAGAPQRRVEARQLLGNSLLHLNPKSCKILTAWYSSSFRVAKYGPITIVRPGLLLLQRIEVVSGGFEPLALIGALPKKFRKFTFHTHPKNFEILIESYSPSFKITKYGRITLLRPKLRSAWRIEVWLVMVSHQHCQEFSQIHLESQTQDFSRVFQLLMASRSPCFKTAKYGLITLSRCNLRSLSWFKVEHPRGQLLAPARTKAPTSKRHNKRILGPNEASTYEIFLE